MKKYIVVHDWHLNGCVGHLEESFVDKDEALSVFNNLRLLIETDDYDFDVKFSDYVEGSDRYSAYQDEHSLMNRQDLRILEVSL